MKRLALVLLAGCGFQSTAPQSAPPDASNSISDAPPSPDAPVAMDDARSCFGSLTNVCLAAAPPATLTLGGAPATLDTGIDGNCAQIVTQTGGPSLCVIAARIVTIGETLVAIGTRPLVLIGTDAINVVGVLDASSTTSSAGGPRKGAGANTGACTTAGVTGQGDAGGGGGGGGGSFGIAGGKGGIGDGNDNGLPFGSARGGAAGATQATPSILRGGCAGGKGGDSSAAHRGGAGGDGGGAVYLIAGRTITIMGDVFASGAGGHANPDASGIEQGGGGGGAGGMIVLDARTVSVSGRVVANGGGGAGGGGLNTGGMPGGDGTTTGWNTRAPGGAPAEAAAGTGAQGAAVGLTTNLDGQDADGGGGGAAGGLGLVWIYGGTLQGGAQISPGPTFR